MPIPDLDRALTVAMRAISLAVQHTVNHEPSHISTKGDRDVVTNVDLDVEHIIRDLLRDWDSTVGFLG